MLIVDTIANLLRNKQRHKQHVLLLNIEPSKPGGFTKSETCKKKHRNGPYIAMVPTFSNILDVVKSPLDVVKSQDQTLNAPLFL